MSPSRLNIYDSGLVATSSPVLLRVTRSPSLSYSSMAMAFSFSDVPRLSCCERQITTWVGTERDTWRRYWTCDRDVSTRLIVDQDSRRRQPSAQCHVTIVTASGCRLLVSSACSYLRIDLDRFMIGTSSCRLLIPFPFDGGCCMPSRIGIEETTHVDV